MSISKEDFYEYLKARRSPLTVRMYKHVIDRYFDWCKGEVNGETARRFLEDIEKKKKTCNAKPKPATTRLFYSALVRFLKWGEVELGPVSGYEPPRPNRERRTALSPEEVASILNACENIQEKVVIRMLYDCALRIGELLKVSVEDVDSSRGYLVVHSEKKKGTDKPDIIPIDRSLIDLMADYIIDADITSGPMFPGMTYRHCYRMVTRISRRAGIPNVTTHSFRHARATHLAQIGTDPNIIKAFMRHSSYASTQIYVNIPPEHVKTAIKPTLPEA